MYSPARPYRRVIPVAATLVALLSPSLNAAPKRVFSVEDLYKVGRVSQLEVSPDAALAVFVVKSFEMEANKGTAHLWIADLDKREARQLTNADKSDWHPNWMPDGRMLLNPPRFSENLTTDIQVIARLNGKARSFLVILLE